MGRISLNTLSDYHKHGIDLECRCKSCGHCVILTPDDLFARGITGSVDRVERRLRCKVCGGRATICSTGAGPGAGKRRGRTWRDAYGPG